MLARLDIHAVRNISQASLSVAAPVNVLWGDNGSGKTSVLEAIYLLGRGRSFRSAQLAPVIQHDQTRCAIFARLHDTDALLPGGRIGVERSRTGEGRMRINGELVENASRLAEVLPLQVINAESFRLLEGGPQERRQFMDWGVFHVEHQFLPHWRKYQQALRQRNTLLRHAKITPGELAPWDALLIESGAILDRLRQQYILDIRPIFDRWVRELGGVQDLELCYQRGWAEGMELPRALAESLERDSRLGVTHKGPHRADMPIMRGGRPAEETMSRGQIKIAVCALRIAQGDLLKKRQGSGCLFLLDDLPAELDVEHRRRLCQGLFTSGNQIFVTAVEPASLEGCWAPETPINWFHVEHGTIGSRKS